MVVQQKDSNVSEDHFIFVKSEYDNVKIELKRIKYIQGLKDYLKIYLSNNEKPILTLMSFKEIEIKELKRAMQEHMIPVRL